MSRATEIDVKDFMRQYKKIPQVNKNAVYVSAKEYAVIVGMHPVTILKFLENGKIEGAIKVGGRWRIPVTS